jgi:hypothetical protein
MSALNRTADGIGPNMRLKSREAAGSPILNGHQIRTFRTLTKNCQKHLMAPGPRLSPVKTSKTWDVQRSAIVR